MKSTLIRNPLIFSLDVDTREEVDYFVNQVSPLVGAIKVGPRLIMKYGADLVNHLAHHAPIFVDNKYFDITSTMESAIRSTFDAGASLATVHALAGPESLKALAELEIKLNHIRPFKILAVTILTSWNEQSYPCALKQLSVEEHVKDLAQQVSSSGLSGMVCSGHELNLLKHLDLFKVTPGIRIEEDTNLHELQNSDSKSKLNSEASSDVKSVVKLETQYSDDQKRVMTPAEALKNGSSALVIGRPILKAQDPRKMVEKILSSL